MYCHGKRNINKVTSENSKDNCTRGMYASDCTNAAILDGVFSDELKWADVIFHYVKSVPDDKTITNGKAFLEAKLSPHLCCFLLKVLLTTFPFLLFNWQYRIDKHGVVGTVLIDLYTV